MRLPIAIADREQREGRRDPGEDASGPSTLAKRTDRMLTVAAGHGYLTVRPRSSKNAMIAGAAPTRKAATAEMSVPRRPIDAWW